MLKRLFIALAILTSSVAAHASGTIPLSMTQQFNQLGIPLSGCQLFIIQAGTTSTPQNAYKDTALTNPQPNPMICDSSGRLPQFFLADGQIKIRLLDSLGNPQVTLDNILVIGPTSGGGSGATIDPTTIAATGDLKHAYGTQVITGWVRSNGRTIGNATSGATERANADTNALFLYLWAADPNLTVSGGRTTAAADYAANKTITLPDMRGRALAGLDDMGNAAAGRLTSSYFGTSAIVLGASGGAESHTMTTAEMPVHSHGVTDPGHSHTFSAAQIGTAGLLSGGTGSAFGTGVGSTATVGTGITINNAGSGNAHAVVQPTMLATIYIKL